MVILGLIFEELTFIFPVSLIHVNSFYFLIFYNTHPNRYEASLCSFDMHCWDRLAP